jgi:hypothetical protein
MLCALTCEINSSFEFRRCRTRLSVLPGIGWRMQAARIAHACPSTPAAAIRPLHPEEFRMPLSNMAVRDIETVIHPYTNLARHREVGPTILNEGRGIYLYDDSGKRYIEGMAGLWRPQPPCARCPSPMPSAANRMTG